MLIGLGSDWSPTGSKNIFGELKIARIYSQSNGYIFSDTELLELATINAAKILKWDKYLGSLEPGKRADLLVINGIKGNPYEKFFLSSEKEISFVVINGIPRFGYPGLMKKFGKGTENWKVGGLKRTLNLNQESLDPAVGALTLKEAAKKLKDGLKNLPKLAKDLKKKSVPLMNLGTPGTTNWFLVLDHSELEGASPRLHLSASDTDSKSNRLAASLPVSEIVEPVQLDPLTAADDKDYFNMLSKQLNLPENIKKGLSKK